MAIDLKAIDERLAKAKEDAEFWEKARAILLDPRMAQVSSQNSAVAPIAPAPVSSPHSPMPQPRAYGELIQRVLGVLSETSSVTTADIVASLNDAGYVFQAREPSIAVNGALVSLQDKGLARPVGKRGNARLWRRKKQESAADESPQAA